MCLYDRCRVGVDTVILSDEAERQGSPYYHPLAADIVAGAKPCLNLIIIVYRIAYSR